MMTLAGCDSLPIGLRWRLRMGGLLLGLLIAGLWPSSAAAGSTIYRFIDAEGVVHFSDVAHDRRFKPIKKLSTPFALSRSSRPKAPVQHAFDLLIARTAKSFGVDPALVKAVVAAESNFQVEAVSHAGAQGLMQLMPGTAEEMGVRAPFKAGENLKGGVQYLKAMLDRYGDVERALAAYNAGPGAVDRHGGIPPYRETQAYVKRVLNYYRGYQDHFPRQAP
jgi:soluble lytic murein transglycosylase-like protein